MRPCARARIRATIAPTASGAKGSALSACAIAAASARSAASDSRKLPRRSAKPARIAARSSRLKAGPSGPSPGSRIAETRACIGPCASIAPAIPPATARLSATETASAGPSQRRRLGGVAGDVFGGGAETGSGIGQPPASGSRKSASPP